MSDSNQNRPGQSALQFRIGTHSTFFRRMLAQLSNEKIADGKNEGTRPLVSLTARNTDDPAIAMLDAFATVADVLTFYQERIANEGYLRTATERRSVLELARAIGYELGPGVAANAYLAFTVEDATGAPGKATIAAGTQVQSVPAGQGELPQTFEITVEFEARSEWNVLKPRVTQPQLLADDVTHLYLAGVTTGLDVGDLLLLVLDEASGDTEIKQIINIEKDSDNNWTRVDFENQLDIAPFEPVPNPIGIIPTTSQLFNQQNVQSYVIDKKWTEEELSLFLTVNGWNADELITAVEAYLESQETGSIFAFRQRVGFFGHNAPLWAALPKATYTRGDPHPSPGWDANDSNRGTDIWTLSNGSTLYSEADVYLERSVSDVIADTWAVFDGLVYSSELNETERKRKPYKITDVADASLADFALSAKATGLSLTQADGDELPTNLADRVRFKVRKTTAYVQSEALELAPLPIEDKIVAGDTELMLDRMILGLAIGQSVVLAGEREDTAGVYQSELVELSRITHSGGYTTLEFASGLQYGYIRNTVTLNANVVKATHGESVEEILGSGDGSRVNQTFKLRKTPLTYVSAATASGSESTLEVRVNDVLWEEVSSLYGLDSTSENYIVRHEDDGTTNVIFGDGKSGARLPSGAQNVVASYRSGIGEDGEVGEGSLILLKKRPFGVKAVTNPFDASGAEDPELLEDTQVNAPRTVLTLERIVSLQDFENFALTFAGIGKAEAVDLSKKEKRLVHITVTGADGDEVETDLKETLEAAIDAARDVSHAIQIDSYAALYFNLSAKVLVDPSYEAEKVLAEVEEALKEAFSFEERELGQAVSAAEIIGVIHEIEGVKAVDLDELYIVTDSETSQTTTLASVLEAQTARWDEDEILPAQMLIINETGISLEEMAS